MSKIYFKPNLLIPSKFNVDFEIIYDKYAPALYGQILKAVKHKQIAEKILMKIFTQGCNSFNSKPRYLSILCHFLNAARNEIIFQGYKSEILFKTYPQKQHSHTPDANPVHQ